MANLRQLRTRVASIKNIQRVTNAMQLVAAARMRRAQESITAARPYAQQLDRVLQRLSGSVDPSSHPLFADRGGDRTVYVVVTSDRGLCGGFNTNVCRKGFGIIQKQDSVVAVGRKSRNFFNNRHVAMAGTYVDVFRALSFSQAVAIADDVKHQFLSGAVDRVALVYNEFVSVAHQMPVVEQLLPIVPKAVEGGSGEEYLFEPSPEVLLDTLVPRHVNFQVWRALLESNAGEQASRMRAMDNATKNAGDLIEDLTREMNKQRQASITLELMDIIGGAEAVA
ncbi:MAG: ATP synthase F1 subunit gamma [bacterium]|nr:ATP synthase F1 subunit gamma [bacterium]